MDILGVTGDAVGANVGTVVGINVGDGVTHVLKPPNVKSFNVAVSDVDDLVILNILE